MVLIVHEVIEAYIEEGGSLYKLGNNTAAVVGSQFKNPFSSQQSDQQETSD
jgi:hypothetical protein